MHSTDFSSRISLISSAFAWRDQEPLVICSVMGHPITATNYIIVVGRTLMRTIHFEALLARNIYSDACWYPSHPCVVPTSVAAPSSVARRGSESTVTDVGASVVLVRAEAALGTMPNIESYRCWCLSTMKALGPFIFMASLKAGFAIRTVQRRKLLEPHEVTELVEVLHLSSCEKVKPCSRVREGLRRRVTNDA